jgi:hypothetical protein
MAARAGSDSRKFPRPRSPINGIWLGVNADSLREALHPTEYEARTFLGGGGGRSSLVWSCATCSDSRGCQVLAPGESPLQRLTPSVAKTGHVRGE